MSEFRLQKLSEQIRKEISTMIVTGKIKDPRVNPFLSINRVVVSSDLSHAKLYVSSIVHNDKKTEKGVEGLQAAAGFIRNQLSKRLHVYQFPELHFFYDKSMKAGLEMIEKLNALHITSEEECETKESEVSIDSVDTIDAIDDASRSEIG